MGFIRIPLKVFPPADGDQPVEVEALVDTGAIYSILPKVLLESIGVTATDRGQFRTIEGRPIERDVTNVAIEVAGRRSVGMVPVILGESQDEPVLGVTGLEMLGMEVDPTRGELRPIEFLLLTLTGPLMRGRAHKFGAHIDTDQIVPAKYLITTDPTTLGEHCMENNDPEFAGRVQPGDVIVADVNFGCGSSREHAQISIKGCGVSCVIAKSFARIFFRNAINQGLPVLESPEAVDGIEPGDELEVDLSTGTIRNVTRNTAFQAKPYEPFLLELLAAGGIIEYTKRKLSRAKG